MNPLRLLILLIAVGCGTNAAEQRRNAAAMAKAWKKVNARNKRKDAKSRKSRKTRDDHGEHRGRHDSSGGGSSDDDDADTIAAEAADTVLAEALFSQAQTFLEQSDKELAYLTTLIETYEEDRDSDLRLADSVVIELESAWLTIEDRDHQIEHLTERNAHLHRQLKASQAENQRLRVEVEKLQTALETTNDNLAETLAALEDCRTEQTQCCAEAERLKEALAASEAQTVAFQRALEEAQAEIERQGAVAAAKARELHSLIARLEAELEASRRDLCRERDYFRGERDRFGREREHFGREREHFGRERDHFGRDRDQLGRDLKAVRGSEDRLRASVEDRHRALKAERRSKTDMEQRLQAEIDRLRRLLREAEDRAAESGRRTSTLARSADRADSLAGELHRAAERARKLEAELDKAQRENQELEACLARAEGAHRDCGDRIAELQRQFREAEEASSKQGRADSRVRELEAELSRLQEERREWGRERAKLEAEIRELRGVGAGTATLQAEVNELQFEIRQLKAKLGGFEEADVPKLRETIETYGRRLEAQAAELREKDAQIHDLRKQNEQQRAAIEARVPSTRPAARKATTTARYTSPRRRYPSPRRPIAGFGCTRHGAGGDCSICNGYISPDRGKTGYFSTYSRSYDRYGPWKPLGRNPDLTQPTHYH